MHDWYRSNIKDIEPTGIVVKVKLFNCLERETNKIKGLVCKKKKKIIKSVEIKMIGIKHLGLGR